MSQGVGGAGAPATSSKDEQTWGMLCHLSGIAGWVGPLIVWLIKKDEYAMVNREGKKALNFQITIFIAWVALFVFSIVLGFILPVFFFFAFLPWLVYLVSLVFTIVATVKTSNGEEYNYPVSFKFIR